MSAFHRLHTAALYPASINSCTAQRFMNSPRRREKKKRRSLYRTQLLQVRLGGTRVARGTLHPFWKIVAVVYTGPPVLCNTSSLSSCRVIRTWVNSYSASYQRKVRTSPTHTNLIYIGTSTSYYYCCWAIVITSAMPEKCSWHETPRS